MCMKQAPAPEEHQSTLLQPTVHDLSHAIADLKRLLARLVESSAQD
jgi:hypothetical protein